MKVLFLAAAAAATALAVVGGPGAVGAALAAPAAPLAAITAAAAAGPGFYPGTPMAAAAGSASAGAPGVASGPAARSVVRSRNWAGYAVTGGHARFQSVQATFFVPYLDCARSGPAATYSSHWVGLDGYADNAVEQDGIAAECHGSRPAYHSWYEMFPQPETPSSMTVRAGDSITALVRYSPSSRKFLLSLSDHTTGGRFSISMRCQHGVTCARSSAEVISEAPATIRSGKLVLLPLADYQAVEFTAIGITQGGGARGGIRSGHWQTTKIIQVRASDSSVILAQPTPVHADVFANYWARQH